MKRNTAIKLKAAFLIVVFALNTVVGFACAVGTDMGFNSKHHHDDEEATEMTGHVHADGAKHHHDKKDKSTKDDCCNDKVLKISQTDKAIPQGNTVISPVFVTAFISSFYVEDVLYAHLKLLNSRYVFRTYHPPIPDIRIAIQSFQI